MKKSWELSRRAFLGGAGALVALPTLEVMWPSVARAQAAGAPAPRRLFFFYVPCGIHMPNWTPAQEGAGWASTPILRPLEDAGVKGDVLVLSNLDNYAGAAQGDGAGDHARGTGSFLTCAHVFKTAGDGIRNGISVDQVAANALRGQTRFASLELGIDGGGATGGGDSGYSCAYARNISWANETTPMPKETSTQATFDRLFGGLDPNATRAQIEKRRRYRLSLLDFVLDDAGALERKISTSDRRKLDQYLTGIRELELRIQSEDTAQICDPGPRPDSGDFRTKVQNMLDLSTLAFQCDQTRVVTFMLGNAGSGRVYDFLGISRGHHEISHHQDDATNFAELSAIDTWEVSQFAYLVQRLKTLEDESGPLLDSSAVFFGSEIEDGNSHSHRKMPILLAGRGGGAFSPGRHVRYPDGTPCANLFLSMLGTVGVQAGGFGDDGTGPLDGLA